MRVAVTLEDPSQHNATKLVRDKSYSSGVQGSHGGVSEEYPGPFACVSEEITKLLNTCSFPCSTYF
jgi:hypothetical protein